MARWIIIPNVRRAPLKAMRMKDTRVTKGPQNVGWSIDPIPLKDGTGHAVPHSVLTHPMYNAIKPELAGYPVKNWSEAEEVANLDIPKDDKLIIPKDTK